MEGGCKGRKNRGRGEGGISRTASAKKGVTYLMKTRHVSRKGGGWILKSWWPQIEHEQLHVVQKSAGDVDRTKRVFVLQRVLEKH